jgi:MFS transporter, YNFM family, putative membrane transport protein
MNSFAAPGSPAFRRIALALFLAGFATFSLLYCVQPLLPLLASDFAVSPAVSSLALSFSTAALALSVFMAGPYSEWVGRRGLMAVSIAAASLCDIGAAFAPDWHLLLLLRAAEGYALGGVPAVAMAYLAEEIEPRGLGTAMGLYVAGTALGGVSGRVIAGLVAGAFGWRGAIMSIGLMGLVLALGFVLLLPPSRNFTAKPGFRPRYHFAAWFTHLKHPGLPALFVIGGLVMGAFVTVYNYIGFLLAGPPYWLTPAEAGLIFTVYVAGIFSSSVAGWFSDRMGRLTVLLASIGLGLVGIALTLLAPLALVVLGITLITASFFAAHAVASGWVGRLAASDKGHATSLYLVVYYLGSSVAGSLGGWFWAGAGWPGVAAFCGAMLLAAVLVSLRLHQPRPV